MRSEDDGQLSLTMDISLISGAVGALVAMLCIGAYVWLRTRFASLDWGVVALAAIAGAFAAAVMFDQSWFV